LCFIGLDSWERTTFTGQLFSRQPGHKSRDRRAHTGKPGQNSLDKSPGQVAWTGQRRENGQNTIARTGLLVQGQTRQDNCGRTASTGKSGLVKRDKIGGTCQPGQVDLKVSLDGSDWTDRENRTVIK
jgi:hypothetical protein